MEVERGTMIMEEGGDVNSDEWDMKSTMLWILGTGTIECWKARWQIQSQV